MVEKGMEMTLLRDGEAITGVRSHEINMLRQYWCVDRVGIHKAKGGDDLVNKHSLQD